MFEEIKRTKTCQFCGDRFEDVLLGLGDVWPERPSVWKRRKLGACKTCQATNDKHDQFMRDVYTRTITLDMDFDQVKAHFVENPPSIGDQVIVLSTAYCSHDHVTVEIHTVEAIGHQKRIVVENSTGSHSGRSFHRSGKNVHAPTGQTRLYPFNQKVADLVKRDGKILNVDDLAEALEINTVPPCEKQPYKLVEVGGKIVKVNDSE